MKNTTLIETAALLLLREEFFKDLARLQEQDLLIIKKYKKDLQKKRNRNKLFFPLNQKETTL